jgi:hypothetical protein
VPGRREVLSESAESRDLIERIHDDPPDAGRKPSDELSVRLVVAVQNKAIGGDPGRQRDLELPPGGDVETQALLVHEPRHRLAKERLRRVRDAIIERRARLATARPDVRLVVDEQGRAMLLGQRDDIGSAHAELPGIVDRRVLR